MKNKKRTTRSVSKAQEQWVASTLDGKVQSNSGATPFQKGDVITNLMLLECKTSMSEKQSYTIKKSELEKNKLEARQMGKPHSALVFNFGDVIDNYAVIELDTLAVLLHAYNAYYGEEEE